MYSENYLVARQTLSRLKDVHPSKQLQAMQEILLLESYLLRGRIQFERELLSTFVVAASQGNCPCVKESFDLWTDICERLYAEQARVIELLAGIRQREMDAESRDKPGDADQEKTRKEIEKCFSEFSKKMLERVQVMEKAENIDEMAIHELRAITACAEGEPVRGQA